MIAGLGFILALGLSVPLPSRASDDRGATAAERLLDRLASLRAYRGHFQQSVRGEGGRIIDRSSGEVAFDRPGLLRWHTTQPFEQLLISDGDSVWFYDPDLAQATRRALGTDITQLPGLLLTGRTDALTNRFEVTVVREGNPNEATFVLEPREREGSALVRASLHFEGAALTSLQLFDAIGNTTRIQLQGDVLDHLPRQLFEFHPPEGVEVVDARTP